MKQEYIDAIKLIFDNFDKAHVELEPEEAMELLSQLNQFNSFSPEEVIKGIKAINELIQKAGTRPISGTYHHSYIIGKEYSLVIYLVVKKFYMPEDFDYLDLYESVRAIAEKIQ